MAPLYQSATEAKAKRHDIGTLHACGMCVSLRCECKTFQYNRFDWSHVTDFQPFASTRPGSNHLRIVDVMCGKEASVRFK